MLTHPFIYSTLLGLANHTAIHESIHSFSHSQGANHMPGTGDPAVNMQTDQPTAPSDQSLIQQIQDNREARRLSWQWGWNKEQHRVPALKEHVR